MYENSKAKAEHIFILLLNEDLSASTAGSSEAAQVLKLISA